MLDDVSGLIMTQIISKLGSSEATFSAVTVIRPVFVSISFAIGVPFICFLLIKPVVNKWQLFFTKSPFKSVSKVQMSVSLHTAILIGFVVASSYAGTSNLFGAYLAGACISWYDGEIASGMPLSLKQESPIEIDGINIEKGFSCSDTNLNCPSKPNSIHVARESKQVRSVTRYTENIECPAPAVLRSIDEKLIDQGKRRTQELKIPATNEECHSISGDVVTGVCTWCASYEKPVSAILKPFFFSSIGFSIPISEMFKGPVVWRGLVFSIMMILAKLLCGAWLLEFSLNRSDSCVTDGQNKLQRLLRLKSFNPALFVGSAMVARGEIGFLIAAIAQSRGIFSSDQFLVVMWSIMVWTIIGPITMGILTRRFPNYNF